MRRVLLLFPIVVLSLSLAAFAQLQAPVADNTPKVGEKAPEFELMKDFAGKQKILLAFFPAAFTGG